MSVHEEMPRKVNKVFVSQPSNLGGGSSNPHRPQGLPGPPWYFGLPMVNPYMPPLPLNRPYH